MKQPVAGQPETVDVKAFILAQPSRDDFALAKGMNRLDWLKAQKLLSEENVAAYCEDIANSVVYALTQQVENERLWRGVFDGLLNYAYQKYFSKGPTVACR